MQTKTPVKFERYVNSKDNQTQRVGLTRNSAFERYVNSKDNQTNAAEKNIITLFERYVNSKDNQTVILRVLLLNSLRDM